MFSNVDFADLTTLVDGVYVFDDATETAQHPVDPASQALYQGLRSTAPYSFSWE
jgi:hypothetical protein